MLVVDADVSRGRRHRLRRELGLQRVGVELAGKRRERGPLDLVHRLGGCEQQLKRERSWRPELLDVLAARIQMVLLKESAPGMWITAQPLPFCLGRLTLGLLLCSRGVVWRTSGVQTVEQRQPAARYGQIVPTGLAQRALPASL